MTSAVEVLAAGNIIDPSSVVRLAAAAGLDLAAAATLLQMESGGGRNVWGHDAVVTGGAYVKGAAVTEAAYKMYLTIRGRHGAQGVGPCQLTWPGFQDQADRRGGCWRWDVNCAVGFETLAQLQAKYGVEAGFARYNGTGPAAVAYGQRAMQRYNAWRARLGGVTDPTPQEDPVTLDEADVQRIADAVVNRQIVNTFGDTVALQQVINGIEQRVADLQARLEPHT